MVADEVDYVVGVDTHLDEHVLAVVASPGGAVVRNGRLLRTVAATRRRSDSRNATRVALACGRSKARATTALAWPVI